MQSLGLGLQIPTTFTLTTALDKLSVSSICQTFTWAAGITSFYKAFDSLAKSRTPFLSDKQPMPDEETSARISRGRKQASLCYFIAGCAFAAAGLLQKYGSEIARQLQTIRQR